MSDCIFHLFMKANGSGMHLLIDQCVVLAGKNSLKHQIRITLKLISESFYK